jgi:hypothetical protein
MFGTTDLAGMQAAQEGHMMDTCHRLIYSAAASNYGEMVPTYTESSTDIPCGLEQKPGSERWRADMTTLTWDATIRLPIGTTIDTRDRIKITKRFGVAVSGVAYEIVGPVQRGPSGIRLRLQEVKP